LRESYEAYESCLHWLADQDSLRSHILVAMGNLAYKVGNSVIFRGLYHRAVREAYFPLILLK
jgi:hypothetical protein